MSFFGMGGGRPQPSSAERIAAAEAEIELVSDMFNRYVSSKLTIAALCPPGDPGHPYPIRTAHPSARLHEAAHSLHPLTNAKLTPSPFGTTGYQPHA